MHFVAKIFKKIELWSQKKQFMSTWTIQKNTNILIKVCRQQIKLFDLIVPKQSEHTKCMEHILVILEEVENVVKSPAKRFGRLCAL